MNERLSAPALDGIIARIRYGPSGANLVEARIAAAILEDPQHVSRESIVGFATRTAVSTGSVVRFAKRLGLAGYQELRLALAAAAPADLRQNGQTAPAASRFRRHMDEQVRATLFAIDEIDAQVLDRAAILIAQARRIDIAAVGSSASIGSLLLFALTHTGLHARLLSDSAEQAAAAAFLGPGDVLVAISVSGRTRTVVDAAARAAAEGAGVITITCNARSPLLRSSSLPIVIDAGRGRFETEWPLRTALTAVARALTLAVTDSISPADLRHTRSTWSSGRFGLRYGDRAQAPAAAQPVATAAEPAAAIPGGRNVVALKP